MWWHMKIGSLGDDDVVQLLSCVWLFVTPWPAAYQASLFPTISWSLPKFMSIESVLPSNHLILCCPLLLLPSMFSSIRVFSNESALHIRWPNYWSSSCCISPSNEYSGLISLKIDWFDLLAVQGTLKSLLQHHNLKVLILWYFVDCSPWGFEGLDLTEWLSTAQHNLLYNPTLKSIHDCWMIIRVK